MRIGIDMRMAGTGEGIGRYIEEVVLRLMEIDADNQYFLIFMDQIPVANKFVNQKSNFQVVFTKSKYYSWKEQISFVLELNKLRLDIVHFPSFNAPLLYFKKFVVTIHDLIHHHYPGKKKLRLFHRLAYRLSMMNAVYRSTELITVSNATKNDILKHYRVNPKKISVIYEGISERIREELTPEQIQTVKSKYNITKPYILFVGAWRRYKNVPLLARVFDIIRDRDKKDIELVLVGKEDAYYPDIKDQVFSIKNKEDVKALGFVPDSDLPAIYQGASVFVLPSRFEGFGLIAVEAQVSKIPVAVSDIEVLREVLGRGAEYFDLNSEENVADLVLAAMENETLVKKALENSERFDWVVTAKKTLEIFSKV